MKKQKKLEEKIQRYKDNIMDETDKDFYENTIVIRRTMGELVLRNYKGRIIQEKIAELSEEFEPIKDNVCNRKKKS